MLIVVSCKNGLFFILMSIMLFYPGVLFLLLKQGYKQDIRKIPSIIGGDEKKRHGIVLAKSISAKKYGVTTGEPLVSARRKCPKLLVVPSRFEFYRKCSQAMMKLLSSYTPDSEPFSIDETFLDMTSTIHLFGTPMDTADQIRRRIKDELKFTVNIGIATNKLLAKMASDFEKPDKCHTLYLEEIPKKLWPLPIRDLFFVGQSAQKKLEAIGIHTMAAGRLRPFHPPPPFRGEIRPADPSIRKRH